MPGERICELLDEFEGSGLSAAAFARMVGVKYPTFINWVQRRRKERAVGGEEVSKPEIVTVTAESSEAGTSPTPLPKGVRLLEAVMDSPVEQGRSAAKMSGLLIELPGDCRLRVDTPGQLAMAGELVAMIAQTTRRRC